MALRWWEKGLWQIAYIIGQYMEKQIFQNFHQMSAWGSIAQLLILKSEMKLKNFPKWGVHCTTFPSWTQKWKIYIDIFYGVSCNIKHITAFSNLHSQ